METSTIIAFIACLFFLLIVGKLFIIPIKMLFKLFINSILGGILIIMINWIGGFFGFHIGFNIITAIFIGLLGIPGAMVVIFIKLLL